MALLPDTDLENLLDLARDKSADGKSQLVQIVGDLFFEESRVLNERERSLMTDILKQLIQDVEHSVRKALADLAVHGFVHVVDVAEDERQRQHVGRGHDLAHRAHVEVADRDGTGAQLLDGGEEMCALCPV